MKKPKKYINRYAGDLYDGNLIQVDAPVALDEKINSLPRGLYKVDTFSQPLYLEVLDTTFVYFDGFCIECGEPLANDSTESLCPYCLGTRCYDCNKYYDSDGNCDCEKCPNCGHIFTQEDSGWGEHCPGCAGVACG